MKFFNFLLSILILSICVFTTTISHKSKSHQPQIPLLHSQDNWTYGTINRNPPKKRISPITERYEEMLYNPNKKLISIGLNNSGAVNLNETVVLSNNPIYRSEDGIRGRISKQIRKEIKPELTQHYEEMLKDDHQKIISLGVNTSAYYDPDNQVIISGTQDLIPENAFEKINGNFKFFSNENLYFFSKMNLLLKLKKNREKKKNQEYFNDNARFQEANSNNQIGEENLHIFLSEKYGKLLKFLQIYQEKENHSVEETKLLTRIKSYREMINKMNYLKKYPQDKDFFDKISVLLNQIENQDIATAEDLDNLSNILDSAPILNQKSDELKKTDDNNKKLDKIAKIIPKEDNLNEIKPIFKFSEKSNVENSETKSMKGKISEEVNFVKKLIKEGEMTQEVASKHLSLLKSMIKNKKTQDISKKEVGLNEIKTEVKKMLQDYPKSNKNAFLNDFLELKSYLQQGSDSKPKENLAKIISDLEQDIKFENNDGVKLKLQEILHNVEDKKIYIENRAFEYDRLASKIEETENSVENGQFYEADESLMQAEDKINSKESLKN